MRQAHSIALMLVVLVFSGWTLHASAGSTEVIEQAKSLLAKHEYQKAASLLEEGLPASAPADRGEMVRLLRQTYQNLIKQAEAAGNAREAAETRDNLAILEPEPARAAGAEGESKSVPVPLPSSSRAVADGSRSQSGGNLAIPRSSASQEQPIQEMKEPGPLPEPAAMPSLDGPVPAEPNSHAATPLPQKVAARTNPPSRSPTRIDAGVSLAAGAAAPSEPDQSAAPASETTNSGPSLGLAQPPAPKSQLEQADQWFTEKKYAESGRAYARLAAQNQLPVQRKQAWAYCRWVAVVALINAHPQSDHEWDAIEQELRSVQKLTPGNWYGEYLQNRVAEARRGRGASRNGKLVVRGSAPEDDPPSRFPRLLARARPAPVSPQETEPSSGPEQPLGLPAATAQGAREPADAAPPQQAGEENHGDEASSAPASPQPLAWHVRETRNFRVYYTDSTNAERAAEAAEAARGQQAKRWGSSAARLTWSPPCDIYLYPTSKDFARLTGQPETSPGFSTMSINGNRVVGRRVNLRSDHPQMLTAILPHEVTHVVLADLFTQQQIPRWADEGMAVLAEPKTEQVSRASELNDPLNDGRVFKLSELMAIDYPSPDAWNLYYAQSVSLTQFLVQLDSPERFVGFVKTAQRKGIEVALRDSYQINGFAELENRWQNFARRQAAEVATSSRDTATALDGVRRE